MATNFKIKRSAVQGKKPATTDLELGELALNTYDGFLYAERTGHGAGVSLLTPWREKNVSPPEDVISYTGAVGIGSTDPEGKLDVIGNVNIVVPTVSNYRTVLFLANDSNISGTTSDLTFDLKNGGARITTGSPGTSLVLGTQGSESIHIDAMGRVGIGTTQPKIAIGGLYVQNGLAVEAGVSSVRNFHIRSAASSPRIYYDNSIADALIFKDDVEARFGDSSDLRIYHNDSINYNEIRGDNGVLRIRNYDTTSFGKYLYLQSENVQIRSHTNNHSMISAFAGDRVDLHFNNDRKFSTTGYGVTVYGEAQFTGLSTFLSGASFLDNDVLYFGGSYSTGISTDHRLRIYSDGTDSYISEATGAGHLILSSDSRVEIKNAALNHTVASFNTGIGVTVNDRFKVVGIATLGSGSSGQAFLQYQGSTKLTTFAWGVRTNGTLQALGGRLETAHTGSQTEAYSIKLLNLDGLGGTKELIEIGHTSNNSFITGHVGKIDINAPVVSISTHFSVAGVSTFADDVTFQTANGNNIVFDKSDNSLQFGDNVAAKFGSGNDLTLFHSGSVGVLRNTQGNFKIEPKSGEKGLVVLPNAGVELYHDNVQKLVTTVDGVKITGIVTATEATLGSIGISTGRITGPAKTYIDPATVGTAGTVFILGDLQVEGTQTVVNSSTMTVTDKNIELAKGAANDAAADGGGITVESGGGNKTWQWVDATDSWTSSEHIRIPDDKAFGFATDTNTFISRPVADTITFTHGGSEKVRITSDGEVGIGTTNPGRGSLDAKLHVSSTDLNTVIIERSPNSDSDPYGSRIAFIDALSPPGQGAYIQGYNGVSIELGTSNGPRFTASDANGGRVGINTDSLDVMGFYVLDVDGSTLIKGNVVSTGSSTTGISTVVGVGTFKDDVYIDKKLYVGGIEIGGPGGPGIGTDITTRHLTVTGLSTFTGAIDANGDLDVDGQTNLDDVSIDGDVSVTGVSTFTGLVKLPDSTNNQTGRMMFGDGTDLQIYHTGSAGEFANFTGNLNIRANNFRVFNGGANQSYITADQNSSVSIAFSGTNKLSTTGYGVTVFGTTETQTLNVTGVSTFVSFLDVNDTTQSSDKDTGSIITEGGVGIEKNLNVGGIINSSTDVQINGTSVVDSALNDAVAMAIALG